MQKLKKKINISSDKTVEQEWNEVAPKQEV